MFHQCGVSFIQNPVKKKNTLTVFQDHIAIYLNAFMYI